MSNQPVVTSSRNLSEHLFNPRTVVCKSAKDVLVKMRRLYFREIYIVSLLATDVFGPLPATMGIGEHPEPTKMTIKI